MYRGRRGPISLDVDHRSIWRRLTGVRGLAGLRRALLAAALLSLVAVATSLLLAPEWGRQWDLPACAALSTLALRWWSLHRTERQGIVADLVEAGAITALGVSIGAGNAMPVILAGLTFRSQYGSRRRVFAGAVLYAVAQAAATAVAVDRFPDFTLVAALTLVPLLLMVPGSAAELARGLAAIEAGARREHALAHAVSSFLVARGPEELAGRAEEAIDDVLAGRIAGRAVAFGDSAAARARNRLAASFELPIGARGALLLRSTQQLSAADERWLATLADQLALAAGAQAARSDAAAERIRTLVERTGGVALLVDASLTVQSATPGARELFGEAAAALAGRSVPDLLHEADRGRARATLDAAMAGGDRDAERVQVRLHSDRERWAELSLADLRADGTMTAYVIHLRDVTARVALEEDARQRDGHDPLTGLPNRERFERMLADELLAGNASLAVALVDLHDFRIINETLGYAAGDAALAEVARRLVRTVGDRGCVARVAGDDFGILISDSADGAELLPRILRVLNRPLETVPGARCVSANAGVARAQHELRSGKALLAAADAALEAAHGDGPGRWTLFALEHHAERLERAVLQSALAEGIGRGQLELDYQPVVDAVSGAWRSAEALVRWRHPELGRLGPDRFIGLAEKSELIVAVGEWVLEEACRQLAEWRRAGVVPEDFGVAVNVSGIQVDRDDLLQHVGAALDRHGLPPQRLTLEITETAMVTSGDVAERIGRLRALGVRIAIDDFGTGHSSLAYLKDLPADVVKLPRPFIRDADKSRSGAAIIQGLVGLARPLGLQVVAEGVESPDQRVCVIAAGCDRIQGFLFAAPMRPEEFAAQATSSAKPAGDFLGRSRAFSRAA
jgi:diguanylate cyclase (GGDEF)-like protein/PAS domain S-box-containing protein